MDKDDSLFQQGLALRKQVLGEQHVARSMAAEDSWNAPIQQFVTEIGWGYVWNRPGLDKKTRSMITVSMLVALGSEHELRIHLKGAVNNGVTEKELQEILLHSAIYAGAPAALAAFRTAREVLDTMAQTPGTEP